MTGSQESYQEELNFGAAKSSSPINQDLGEKNVLENMDSLSNPSQESSFDVDKMIYREEKIRASLSDLDKISDLLKETNTSRRKSVSQKGAEDVFEEKSN